MTLLFKCGLALAVTLPLDYVLASQGVDGALRYLVSISIGLAVGVLF